MHIFDLEHWSLRQAGPRQIVMRDNFSSTSIMRTKSGFEYFGDNYSNAKAYHIGRIIGDIVGRNTRTSDFIG